jgi:hypothetical protein
MSPRSARHRRRLVNTPRIGPVAPSRAAQFVDRAQELRTVRGLDAVFRHRENRPLVILDFSREEQARSFAVKQVFSCYSSPAARSP